MSAIPLSSYNLDVLRDYGDKVYVGHLKAFYAHHPRLRIRSGDEEPSSWLGRLWRWLNPWQIGERLGIAVGITYAADIARRIITDIATVYFSDVDGWLRTSLIEGARIAFTPLMQPFIVAGVGFAGGVVISAIFGTIEAIHGWCVGSRVERRELRNIQDLTILIDRESGKVAGGNEVYSGEELNNLVKRVKSYLICQRLMGLQRCQVDGFFEEYAPIIRHLTGEKLSKVEKARRYLSGLNPTAEKKEIRAVVKLFSRERT